MSSAGDGSTFAHEVDDWYVCFTNNTSATRRLFYFPHAGSGVASFRKWLDQIDTDIDLRIVQAPGRGSRIREPGATRFPPLINELCIHIKDLSDMPFIFFGHSLGALIAYELARELQRRDARGPEQLMVAASRAPHIPLREAPTHRLCDEDFLIEMKKASTTPLEVLANKKLVQLFLPALKRDAELGETYVYETGDPIDTPITALHALHDSSTTRADLLAWSEHTRDRFEFFEFDDDHFFINKHITSIAGMWRWSMNCMGT